MATKKQKTRPDDVEIWTLGGATAILKNDGVRQWEGWHPIYDMEKQNVPNRHQSDIQLL
jgi:hypothetical protein